MFNEEMLGIFRKWNRLLFFFLVTSDSKALLISPPKHMQEMSEVWQVTKFKRWLYFFQPSLWVITQLKKDMKSKNVCAVLV